jgi:chromosome segregation protein
MSNILENIFIQPTLFLIMTTHVSGLHMRGFKSFNNKATLELGPGLNCVVGPNGSGKSVEYNTQVLFSDGSIQKIGDVVEKKLKELSNQTMDDGVFALNSLSSSKVLSLNQETGKIEEKPISAFIRRDGEELYEIKTNLLKKVRTTGCHPIIVFRDGKIQSSLVRNLKGDDLIASPRRLNFDNSKYVNLDTKFHNVLDKDFARLLGYLIGDGYMPYNRIEFVNNSKELIDDFIKLAQKVTKKTTFHRRERKNASRVIFYGVDFSKYLYSLFKQEYSKEVIPRAITSEFKNIPKELFNSPDSVIANLLGALFDCDGHVYRNLSTFEFVNKNEELIDQVQLLLLRFGIVARKRETIKYASNTIKKTKRKYFALYIEGNESLSKLFKQIPFRCKNKFDRLKLATEREIISNTNTDILPKELNIIVKKLVNLILIKYKPLRKKYPFLGAYIENRCHPTRQGIFKLIYLFQERILQLEHIQRNLEVNQEALMESLDILNISRQSASQAIGLSKQTINNSWISQGFNARPINLEKLYNYLDVDLTLRLSGAQQQLAVLQMLATSDIFWERIISIDKTEKVDYVYDLTIQDNHNFIGNGIFVHNSNILDSICFVLGRSSAKSIRAESVADLIHKKKDSHVGSADVVFRLDNSNKTFPIDSKHIEITRRITKEGLTKYYINGKRASRRQVVELLSIARIFSEGHNIILQGDIDKFISMSPIEKRGIIEEVAGISVYESKKQDALRELGKVEEKLKEAKIIITEKETYLKGLESEKIQAEKYRSHQNQLNSSKATEIKLRTDAINKKKNEISSKLDKIESTQKKFDQVIDSSKEKVQFIESKIDNIETQIEKKGGEDQLELEHTISDLKLAIENSKNLILNSKNEINRINQRKNQLETNFNDINKKLTEKKKELTNLNSEKVKFEKQQTSLTTSANSSAKSLDELDNLLDKREKEVENLKLTKEKLKDQLNKLTSDTKILDFKLQEIDVKLQEVNKNQATLKKVHKSKDYYKSVIDRINKLASKDSNFAIKLQDLRQKVDTKSELVAKLKIDNRANDELLMRDRAISQILSSKKQAPGIIGTVAQLATSKKEYQQALAVAAGSRMRNVVVDNENVAVKCLQILKQNRAGIATFLPLNKLKTRDWSALSIQAANQRGVFGLASELVQCDLKYKRVFQYIFRDTIIVQDTNIAKSMGIGRFSMVTLEGDVFSTSGAITGGFRRRDTGVKFAERDATIKIDKEQSELSIIKKELNRTEKERNELQEMLIKLRQEKAELEGTIGSTELSETDPSKVLQNKKDLMTQHKQSAIEISNLQKQEIKLITQIEKAIVEKNSVAIKIKNLRFGSQSSELKKIESAIKTLDARIATIQAIVENSLEPEHENIKKLLIHLQKEQAEFDEQIIVEEKNIKNNTKSLDTKQKEEKEFYGSLKKLFAEKKKYVELMEKEQSKIKELNSQMTGDNEERNALNIARAKIEAEFAAISEEFNEYKNFKTLPHLNNVTQAKRLQEELKKKIEHLGSVNMRALEIYDNVKKEYDSLSWRLEKLGKERESVIYVIGQIEHKKIDSFMTTFQNVNKYFTNIFEKISHKMRAELILENKEKPFDGGINIRVRDQNAKAMYLGSLSGGEKTLVALAFIFAVQEHDPAPFYLLDEIDAALDKLNSEKVARLLQEYSKKSQIIIISHNDSIISASDNLYGIWMNKNGESFVNSLKI